MPAADGGATCSGGRRPKASIGRNRDGEWMTRRGHYGDLAAAVEEVGCRGIVVGLVRARRQGEELAGAGDIVDARAAGKQAVVTDAVEAVGQHMAEEATGRGTARLRQVQPRGRARRYQSRRRLSSTEDSMAWRSLRPLPCSTHNIMCWESISDTLSETTSETRSPAP
jgi:hypothetical protein